tara:strand:+ start:1217 stop:2140 length:924 start_codon:yes stop_codon:yes gene_type:complete
MEYVKTYETFMGSLARLNPNRDKNDDKALDLFKEIIEDYEKYDHDLKKVSILDDNNKKISFTEISIGKDYRLQYVFGKFHIVRNSTMSGNNQAGNRHITIMDIPFRITLKKNSLERAFNTNRVNLRRTTVKDIKTINNPNYNSRSERQGEMHLHDKKEDRYRISYDISNQIFNYFVKEYKDQYPNLKDSNYKSSDSIRDIERQSLPKDHDKKVKEQWEIKIDSYLKKHDIILKSKSKWEKFGFRLIIYPYEIRLEFATTDKDISNKIDNVLKEDWGDYKLEHKRVREGYSYDKDGMIFVGIFFENNN